MAAAISSARQGAAVTLVERASQPGRKVLVCGGGRCNLLNERLDESFYNAEAQPLVRSVFSSFGKTQIKDFFSELGLATYAEGDRVFPVTNQASSVLRVLLVEIKRLGIMMKNDFEVVEFSRRSNGFDVKARNGGCVRCEKIIVAAGGRSYPVTGSDGSIIPVVRKLGHAIIEPVPVAVPLIVKDDLCHRLQGQRIMARVEAVINGRPVCRHEGDVLFTRYGLSGTAVLDVSRHVSIALHRCGAGSAALIIDMVPFLQPEALKDEIIRRFDKGIPAEDILCGILPEKFSPVFRPLLKRKEVDGLVSCLKARELIVSGTRGWSEAEFTAGGVAADEINKSTMESLIQRGVYFCGEVLDVDGIRGGYNLAWAWASGLLAGLNSAT